MCAWEQVLLIYGTVYLVFMFIYHDASTEWVYSVLDWDKPASLGLYVFLPLALFISFVIWCASSRQSHKIMPPTVLQVASWRREWLSVHIFGGHLFRGNKRKSSSE